MTTDPIPTPARLPIRLRIALTACTLAAAHGPARAEPIADKTLVAWVTPANLDQQGGSVLTLEKPGGVFDALVFGELAPARWMAGSDFYRRTDRDQEGVPAETATPSDTVMVALVYQGDTIILYRNAAEIARHTVETPETFGDDSFAVLGLRHLAAQGEQTTHFLGSIDDARLYDRPLDAATLAALQPDTRSDPAPLAWWDFEDGSPVDRMGAFPSSTLIGAAAVTDGRLHLPEPGAWLVATRDTPRTESALTASEGGAERQARALREKLVADPHRPGYHFVTPEGTCMPFDPNGAIYWQGRYHLFYIFQDHRGHNWGHASSADLFHWRHHPTGLVDGMFSGNCFLDEDGRPTICYHQVGQGNAMAVAVDDDLDEWVKLDSNPITPRTEPGDPHHGRYRSWDPYGWLEGDTYYAIFGGERAAVARSPSLAGPWEYVGDLLANTVGDVSIEEDISCADFFRLGGRHVLLCISHRLGCRYYVGDWRDEQFHPTHHAQMSWNDHSFFAPESLLDDRGRRIMWAWAMDLPGFRTRAPQGWSGTMSLPRVLTLGDDETLRMTVPEEIERLRRNERRLENITLEDGVPLPLDGIAGNSLELLLDVEMNGAETLGVAVCQSPGGEEETLVVCDAAAGELRIDARRSGDEAEVLGVEAGPFTVPEDGRVQLRIFVDKSIVEAFADDLQGVMRRIYPRRRDSLGVSLVATGGPARVRSLRAWEIAPSNPF